VAVSLLLAICTCLNFAIAIGIEIDVLKGLHHTGLLILVNAAIGGFNLRSLLQQLSNEMPPSPSPHCTPSTPPSSTLPRPS
jgi:hypothetical protein